MSNYTEYTSETTVKQAIEGFMLLDNSAKIAEQVCGQMNYTNQGPGGP